MAWAAVKAIVGGTDEVCEHLESLCLREIAGELGRDVEDLLDLPLRSVLSGLQSPRDQHNQYSYPFGLPGLRRAIADYTERFYGFATDPETEVTVVLGATEGISTVLRAVCEPGDGVIVFQPFHEMYPSQAHIFGLRPRYVTLREDRVAGRWELDREELKGAVSQDTRALILNTPHNPTGKVFSEDDLAYVANLCAEHDLAAITDEIYEHMVYDGHRHHFLASYEGMKERTFVVNSVSKTGRATGWRVGWVLSPESHTTRIRGIHDTLVIQAPTPLQKGSECLLRLGDDFFRSIAVHHAEKRETLAAALRDTGFRVSPPEGSYYLFADYRQVPAIRELAPMEAAMHLIEEVGVASVPGDNFYHEGREGDDYLRFAFCRSLDSLQEAADRLRNRLEGAG
jgi:aminotransferase